MKIRYAAPSSVKNDGAAGYGKSGVAVKKSGRNP
jgi:hypothetical protein